MHQTSPSKGRRGLWVVAERVNGHALVAVHGYLGPVWDVVVPWPWSPACRRTIAELEWLREQTGVSRSEIVAALAELGEADRAAA
jgi:hypothetical protein